MTLPYFDYEVPVLSLPDGTRYIPVVALCRMLDLRSETHIPRWRRLFLWEHARKLPMRTETRGTRIVWCLHLGALFFWCSSFNWSLVSAERRVQLQQATEVGSMPLFPIIPEEESEQFFASIDRLTLWYCDLAVFLKKQALSRQVDHDGEEG